MIEELLTKYFSVIAALVAFIVGYTDLRSRVKNNSDNIRESKEADLELMSKLDNVLLQQNKRDIQMAEISITIKNIESNVNKLSRSFESNNDRLNRQIDDLKKTVDSHNI